MEVPARGGGRWRSWSRRTEVNYASATPRRAQGGGPRGRREPPPPTATRQQVLAVEDRLIGLAKRGGAQVFVPHPWLSWWPTGHTRRELGEAYLTTRGLGRLIARLGYFDLVYAEDGSPTVPLFGLERSDRSNFRNPAINLVTRLIKPGDPARKVLNMRGYPATGTFGCSRSLETNEHLRTLFLVEGRLRLPVGPQALPGGSQRARARRSRCRHAADDHRAPWR
jgi:hypothetical protein